MYYTWGKLVLQIGAALFYYKSGLTLLKIESASFLQIRVSVVTIEEAIANYGNRYYKIGQLLQIGAKHITNWGRYYKLGQLLQIGA